MNKWTPTYYYYNMNERPFGKKLGYNLTKLSFNSVIQILAIQYINTKTQEVNMSKNIPLPQVFKWKTI